MNDVIRTVGGDLESGLAGPTYLHEHLIIDTELVAETMTHIHLPSVEEAVAEVKTCVSVGVRTMVDAMPAGAGRDPERLIRVSVLTGMRVVAATGLHTAKYYGDVSWAGDESAEQLADRFIADIEHGIDRHDYRGLQVERSPARAGIVKVATLGAQWTPAEERLFIAAYLTAEATGVPIMTHTEGGLGGLAQIERLIGLGVAPERIALSHTDKIGDRSYHRAMLSTGVSLCYDQALRQPQETVALIEDMVEAGFVDQIMVGTDGARRSLWATLGGAPGLASLYDRLATALAPDVAQSIFVANPRRFLTLSR